MKAETLNRRLAERGASLESVTRSVIGSPELLDNVISGLESDLAAVRFNSSKVLLAMAQESPETLFPRLRAILKLLDSDNKILKAAAIRTLGRAARVDSRGQITRALGKILRPIAGPDLVVATSAIECAALIARAKPQVMGRVVPALLSVGSGQYRTAECRNIAIGKTLDALLQLDLRSNLRREVEEFVLSQRANSRKSTRERAERLAQRLATTEPRC